MYISFGSHTAQWVETNPWNVTEINTFKSKYYNSENYKN